MFRAELMVTSTLCFDVEPIWRSHRNPDLMRSVFVSFTDTSEQFLHILASLKSKYFRKFAVDFLMVYFTVSGVLLFEKTLLFIFVPY